MLYFLLVWSCKAISQELWAANLLKNEASIKKNIDEMEMEIEREREIEF